MPTRSKLRTAAKFGAVTAIAAALSGCATTPGASPQVLAFNYAVIGNYTGPGATDAADLVNRLHTGQVTVEDQLGSVSCNYTADFSQNTGFSVPAISVSGTPDVPVFNIRVSAANVRTVPNTTQPAGCLPVQDFTLFMGNSTDPWPVGTTTRTGDAHLVFGNGGNRYDFSAFFQAKVISFNQTTGRTVAEFEFADTIQGTPGVVLGRGSFAMDR